MGFGAAAGALRPGRVFVGDGSPVGTPGGVTPACGAASAAGGPVGVAGVTGSGVAAGGRSAAPRWKGSFPRTRLLPISRQLLTEAAASRAPNRGRNASSVRARVPSATQE